MTGAGKDGGGGGDTRRVRTGEGLLTRILYFGYVSFHQLSFLIVSVHADLHG